MNTKSVAILLSILLVVVASISCSRARSDANITADAQTRIHADSALTTAPITVQANSGVVVLSGTVETDAARSAAENAAKQVDGVKGVINNLQLMTAASAPKPPGLVSERQIPKSRPVAKAPKPVKAAVPDNTMEPAAPPARAAAVPLVQPVPLQVIIPQGTAVTVRLIDPVDTEKHKEGDTFRASLDSPVVIEEKTVIPKNADVEARLVSAKSAGRFTGSSEIVLVLTKITVNGKSYDVQTGEFSKQGASRGKRSATVIGGGAAVGAVIGAIAGGGKGAAIGAAAGAGTGTGVQALTKSQQIKLPAETLLEFELKAPLSVIPAGDTAKRETVG
jgi:hypothetical protein